MHRLYSHSYPLLSLFDPALTSVWVYPVPQNALYVSAGMNPVPIPS